MKFWNRLRLHRCAHRFSWPRVDANGRHYQICLLCGIAYEYDWTEMRRTNHVIVPVLEFDNRPGNGSTLR